MNLNRFFQWFVAVTALTSQSLWAGEASARINKVWTEKKNAIVEVQTSGSLFKVTLESSTRIGKRSWEPRAVRYFTNGEPDTVTFTFSVPLSANMEVIRVRADLTEGALPANFYSGTNKFAAPASGAGAVLANNGAETAAPNFNDDASRVAAPDRSVVESDIWKLDGDQLFFYNQYRGLQVINVANPDAPTVTGSYEIAAGGEQMYLIDHSKVVLLARDNCSWYGNGAESGIVLLEVKDGVPQFVKELPINGQIAESRLVGTALYVVANSYHRQVIEKPGAAPSEQWEWGSEVISFDLGDFANAARKSTDWVRGYGNVITATDKILFVAQTDYTFTRGAGSIVHTYDITSPDGTFTKLAEFSAGGAVADKFKMNMVGNTFVVVVQESEARTVAVNTFSFENPQKPALLARLKLIDNERLFATRFDGNLLYVVTFFVIDPLWVVDLSDPAAPKKVGELEIPGWSTYLQPLGDRLLAIGLDRSTNGFQRTAVQLFDVSNPAKPGLLSKVLIGDQWSGSEANWDEKAFGVLPDQNLLLVPFHSSGTNGYTEGVQLIDLNKNDLVKRGVITQDVGARRATVHRDRILSLSSRELLSVDATDRDRPRVTKKTELSWATDQVHLVGDFVIEVDANRSEGPVLRVVDAANTTTLRGNLTLTNLPYLGSAVREGKLYVLQGRSIDYVYPAIYDPNTYKPIATNPAVFVTTVFDLAQLPALPLVSTALKESTRTEYVSGRYEALEVKPGLIVWASGEQSGMIWWWRGGPEIAIDTINTISAMAAPGLAIDIARPGFWYGGGVGHLLAYETGKSAFVSEVQLSSTNGWWSFSRSYTTNGIVYLSHSLNEFDLSIDPPAYSWEYWDGTKTIITTNDPPPGVWVQRNYLDVVDFNEPAEPLVRKPVGIPGSLIGIDRGGEILYTRGYDFQSREGVAASSYDGVEARQIATIPIEQLWPRPSVVNDGLVYLGNPGTNVQSGTLEVWKLSNAGKFELLNSTPVNDQINSIHFFGDLLAAQASEILMLDVTLRTQPRLLGTARVNSCYGAQLQYADGTLQRGLWIPLGWYGSVHVTAEKKP